MNRGLYIRMNSSYVFLCVFLSRREARSADQYSKLPINLTDVSLEFNLRPTRSVLNPGAKVTIVDEGGERRFDQHKGKDDCFLTGHLASDPGQIAVFSECSGLVSCFVCNC